MEQEDLIPLPQTSDDDESEASDNEVNVSDFDNDVMSDSDSEPDCFSFATTQENREKEQKVTAQAIKLQKEELKRKRKQIDLQNLKQREEKRKKIASKRLPDHVLENLDDELESETPGDRIEQEPTEKEEKDTLKEIVKTAGNMTFKCKVLSVEAQKPKYIPQKVANFKEQMLYGGRVKREKSNREAVLKIEKQRIRLKS